MDCTAQALDPTALRTLLEELGTEAFERRFEVAPNPCVGAAVLSGGRVVGRGVHERWGGPHAERVALEDAHRRGVPRERWETLVVTLEPCSTQGKTPPCVEAVLESGVKQVIVGEVDPDPRHRGRGVEALRAAGVEVHLLEGVAPLERVSPHFLRWNDPDRVRRPRPWTIAKWAQTLTGQLLPPEGVGEGRWITSAPALAQVQRLRGRVDAILTGVGTVLADDPRLTVRTPGDLGRPPLRIVLDSDLRTPPDARLFAPVEDPEHEAAGPVVILCRAGASAPRARELQAVGARIHGLHAAGRERLDLFDVHGWMWEEGLKRVLLEAGPTLLGSHLEEGFVDQLRVYTGSVRGGRGESMAEHLRTDKLLERRDAEIGPDAVLEAFLAP